VTARDGERVCIPEERFYYDDPPAPNVPLTPGVSAVIFDAQRRILFMKRTLGDYWSLPGGRLDLGESAPECCVRETFEETGLETWIVRLIAANTNARSIVHYPDGNVHQSFVLCFEVEIIGGLYPINNVSRLTTASIIRCVPGQRGEASGRRLERGRFRRWWWLGPGNGRCSRCGWWDCLRQTSHGFARHRRPASQ